MSALDRFFLACGLTASLAALGLTLGSVYIERARPPLLPTSTTAPTGAFAIGDMFAMPAFTVGLVDNEGREILSFDDEGDVFAPDGRRLCESPSTSEVCWRLRLWAKEARRAHE